MSFQITESFVSQFSGNVTFAAQQQGSILRPFVRFESVQGNEKYFDRIGSTQAVKKTVRHGDTPRMDTPHSRRKVSMSDYEWADMIDNADLIRTLNDPTNMYAQAAMWAMGRAMDTEIISAMGGISYAGDKGQTPVAFPNSQRIHAVAGAALSTINLDTLKKINLKMDLNYVNPMNGGINLGVHPYQVQSLLGITQITSADFNSVKALVSGTVTQFMGINFVKHNGWETDASGLKFDVNTGDYNAAGIANVGSRVTYAWTKDAVVLAVGQEPMSRISERADKSYSTQVFLCMTIGATRMEEEKVIQVLSKDY